MRIDGPIRVGIHAGQQYSDYRSYRELFKTAESLGLDWASVFDHFMPIQADPTGPCFEAYSLIGALGEATETIALGVVVTGVTYRHPAVLANIAATLDHVSGGRLEVGIGAAWYELEHDQYGIAFPDFATRSDMLAEAAQILRSLWTEKRTSFAGLHYQLNAAMCEPKPLRPGGIPLWIGGSGERRTLPTVARYVDRWNALEMPVEDYRRKVQVLEAAAREANREPEDIRRALVFRAVLGTSDAEAQANFEARVAQLPSSAGQDGTFVGTPDALVTHLAPYAQLGARDFLLLARPPVDRPTLELLASSVAPKLRELPHTQ